MLGTNCYILADGPGSGCVVVDPGIGVVDALRGVLAEHRLTPEAIVLTHGHLDHVHGLPQLCDDELPVYIHAEDRYRLDDPYATLGPELRAMMEQQMGPQPDWVVPSRIEEVKGGDRLDIAGRSMLLTHAPGHTEGSMLLELDEVPQGVDGRADVDRTIVAGDVLFAGSIGRTDLPGGDPEVMNATLRDVITPLASSAIVLPGHGPATTMAREKAANPYLQGLG